MREYDSTYTILDLGHQAVMLYCYNNYKKLRTIAMFKIVKFGCQHGAQCHLTTVLQTWSPAGLKNLKKIGHSASQALLTLQFEFIISRVAWRPGWK